MIIAVADSKSSNYWKNLEISWAEFLQRAQTTVRTRETVEEYRRLPKSVQAELKNVGGFVGGKLRDGKRRTGFVEFRSMLTLDLDYAQQDLWEEIKRSFDVACCLYSTHRHTRDKPRLRLILPLLRTISADEYMAVTRMIAADIGLEQFDDTTYEPTRLMYWASTSRDGEFLFESQEGRFLDPDQVLARYKDWRDTSSWPVSSRQTAILSRSVAKQADPLEKPGIVGAFCRAYSIERAIEQFIPEVYSPSLIAGRYDYNLADSTAGVVIYEDKFAYSHHATDPACGTLCNAFDLVRLHKFREFDAFVEEDEPPFKRPSFKAMQTLAVADQGVKRQLARERVARANDADFSAEQDEGKEREKGADKDERKDRDKDTDADTDRDKDTDTDTDTDWQTRLELLRSGEIKDTLSNLILILGRDIKLLGIAYNQHSNCIDVKGDLPWKQVKPGWNDSDIAGAKAYLDRRYRLWSPGKFKDALLAVAAERAYHPVKDYFAALPAWDGVGRLDTLLIDYLGAEDTSYSRAVIRKTLCAVVARIEQPGTKFDHIMVLNGPQGIGKSTFFGRLGGRWFSDSLTISDMRDKTASEKLQGYLILELGELAGIKKLDVETVKSFVSREDDKYRPSYGTTVESHPRQCVIVGSTNSESGFLRDITGNRRFWPVRVGGKSAKKAWELTEVDQVWAETLVKYQAGEDLFLKGDDAQMAIVEQADAMESDDREGLVRDYLERLLPETWRDLDLYARRSFLSGGDLGSTALGSDKRERVCTMELWCECFGKDAVNLKKTDAYELNTIMAKIEGWKKHDSNKLGNFTFPIYGRQRGYLREVNNGEEQA